jgi:hypothetical protein
MATEAPIVTPAQVEKRLRDLSHEIDEAHNDLVASEANYFSIKAEYEITLARHRITLASKSAPNGKNYTVGEREDLALISTEELHFRMATAESLVRSSRANVLRLKTQVEIARSVGSNVRSAIEAL